MFFYYCTLTTDSQSFESPDIKVFSNPPKMRTPQILLVDGEPCSVYGVVISNNKLPYQYCSENNLYPAEAIDQARYLLWLRFIGKEEDVKKFLDTISKMQLIDVVNAAKKDPASLDHLALVSFGIVKGY